MRKFTTGDLRVRVLAEVSVQNGVRDLVAHFVCEFNLVYF